jgi:hypothetical protein
VTHGNPLAGKALKATAGDKAARARSDYIDLRAIKFRRVPLHLGDKIPKVTASGM